MSAQWDRRGFAGGSSEDSADETPPAHSPRLRGPGTVGRRRRLPCGQRPKPQPARYGAYASSARPTTARPAGDLLSHKIRGRLHYHLTTGFSLSTPVTVQMTGATAGTLPSSRSCRGFGRSVQCAHARPGHHGGPTAAGTHARCGTYRGGDSGEDEPTAMKQGAILKPLSRIEIQAASAPDLGSVFSVSESLRRIEVVPVPSPSRRASLRFRLRACNGNRRPVRHHTV
jgi:hypothetical protein